MPTFEQTELGYGNLWKKADIVGKDERTLAGIASKIIANKAMYQTISGVTGVPWYMIGPIHYRESSLNFKAHLHCGDPLTARTVHVPKGRPSKGSPPFTWNESAVDALTMAPHSLNKVKNWSIERILYETERYNGWGYIGKGNSPYVWSGTTIYSGGKYIADHVYSPTAWDKQMGCAAILKKMAKLDDSIVLTHQIDVPSDLIAEDKQQAEADRKRRIARNTAGGGAAVSTTTGGVEATQNKSVDTGIFVGGILFAAAAFGIAIYIIHKRKQAKDQAVLRWTGVR